MLDSASMLRRSALIVSLTQLVITWEEGLNKGLSTLGWPMDMFVG